MIYCPEAKRVQDYLDDELVPDERQAFERHLAGCAACAGELAVYRRVFYELETLPTWDPGPALTERVLAEVMPAHTGRWVRALGWAYAGSIGASLLAIAAAILLPAPRQWTGGLAADAARSVVNSLLFVLKSCNAAALRLVDSFGASGTMMARIAPVLRAVATPLSQPVVVFTLCAAVLFCAAVLWWMRPRESRSIRGTNHVGVLGF
jgi:hypothetical protein